jgi:hypothetical protein
MGMRIFGLGILWLLAALPVAAADFERLPAAGGTFLVDWRGAFAETDRTTLKAWLADLAKCINMLHGRWPRPEIRIALQPVKSDKPYFTDSAVPFARVLRNRPEGVLFYVTPGLELADYVNDWTAYHELSHLFIPYPGRRDVWISEGLASYYQNILQVRAGVLTPAAARERFRAAFQRGRDDNDDADLTLGDLSARMMERRAFMRVYWSGALLFMEADIALRERPPSDGLATSLDEVLRRYGECCLTDGAETTGPQLAADFDRVAGGNLFASLYQRYANTTEMPEFDAILAAAGPVLQPITGRSSHRAGRPGNAALTPAQ